MKVTIRKAAIIAASTFACAALFSPGWSEQGGVSLSIDKAQAQPRRAYYYGGPWSGPGYSYAGWEDYATRNGIGCRPGTAIKGGDGIMYNCQ
jgi:hypothetical protein